jgi:hypothetical protein
MQKLPPPFTLSDGLFGRNATKPSLNGGHSGPVDAHMWCRASILLLLRERECLE